MDIYYLGPKWTFSELAARQRVARMFHGNRVIPCSTLEAVADAAANKDQGMGILPYYNMIDGNVQRTPDLIYRQGLVIVGAEQVPVSFALGEHPNNTHRSRVYVQDKAWGQCTNSMHAKHPSAVPCYTSSNGDSVMRAKEGQKGMAIGMRSALIGAGLQVIEDDITDEEGNYTNFYVVVRNDLIPHVRRVSDTNPASPAGMKTLVAMTPRDDHPGLLETLLHPFSGRSINLTDQYPRPSLEPTNIPEAKTFYMECACPQEDPRLVSALAEAKAVIPNMVVRILGSYEALPTR